MPIKIKNSKGETTFSSLRYRPYCLIRRLYGLIEEITTEIARLPWLFVIARNSSFTYKGRAVDVPQVARELGVRYVLEGSVRKAGDRVRIVGQLIDATTGAHIWADRFDGAIENVFELQDRVASSVAGKLRRAEIERASRKPVEHLDAYDLYLRALAQFHRFTGESLEEAVVLLRRALAIDRIYAPAAALVAQCHYFLWIQGWGRVSADDLAEDVRLAREALETGRDDADSLWRAAYTLFSFAGEIAMAEAILDRALALNPNAASAWGTRGWVHAMRNQPEAAVAALERALRLSPTAKSHADPRSLLVADAIAGQAAFYSGRFAEATRPLDNSFAGGSDREMLELYPIAFSVNATIRIALSHSIMGRFDEAIRSVVQAEHAARALQHGFTLAWVLVWGTTVYLLSGDLDAAKPLLEEGIAAAEQQGFSYLAGLGTITQGWLVARQGQLLIGIERMKYGLNAFQSTGAAIATSYFRVLLAALLLDSQQIEEAFTEITDAEAQMTHWGECWHAAELYRVKAEIVAAGGTADQNCIEETYRRATSTAQQQGAVLWELRARDSRARWLNSLGEIEEMQQTLVTAALSESRKKSR